LKLEPRGVGFHDDCSESIAASVLMALVVSWNCSVMGTLVPWYLNRGSNEEAGRAAVVEA
jgi:hypothetical protein